MRRRGRPPHPDRLTPRELQVIELLAQGLSNPEIAQRLGISRDGVKYHVSEILSKLQVESREDAGRWYERNRVRRQPSFGILALLRRPGPPATRLLVAATGTMVLAGFVALLVGVFLMSARTDPDEQTSDPDILTGDERLDALIDGLLHDDAALLSSRFDGLEAREGVFYEGRLPPPNLPSGGWTERLALSPRSLYAVYNADYPWDDSQGWHPQSPYVRPMREPGLEPDVFIVLTVQVNGEEHGWRFSVQDGEVVDVVIPAAGSPEELRTPSVFTSRWRGEESRYLVLPASRNAYTQQQIESFLLEPVSQPLKFVQDASGAVPSGPGLYFLDIDTGVLEGWNLPGADLYAPVTFSVSGDNQITAATSRSPGDLDRPVLAVRATRTTYSWQADAEVVLSGTGIASAGSRVLFRFPVPFPNPSGEDWFAVVDLAPRPRVVAAFQARGSIGSRPALGLLSPDGKRAAIFASDALYVIDLTSGDIARIADPDGPIDLEGTMSLQNSLGGEAFLLLVSPAKSGFEGFWMHYTWSGDLLAGDTSLDSRYFPSGDGKYLAYSEPIGVGSLGLGSHWQVFSAVDTRDGSPLFRVVGAVQLPDQRENPRAFVGNRWLADGSGFVVASPPRAGSSDGGDSDPILAMQDGSLRPIMGAPSPDSLSVFARGFSVVDAVGNVIARANLPEGATQSLVSPWGDSGHEIRFSPVPPCCHGPPFSIGLVEPHVEQPPYGNSPQLQLTADAAGAELRDTAAGSQVVGSMSGPLRIALRDVEGLLTQPGEAGHEMHCRLLTALTRLETTCQGPLAGLWALVTTEAGLEGWVLLHVGVVGH